MSLIVSCSSLYLCLFAKLLGQSKSTCCSAKLSTLRLFSLSCEQSVRWKRIPWSRSCECLSVHQQPGSSAVNSLGTTWNNKTAEASCNPNSHDLSTCCWLCEDICYSSIMFHLLSTWFKHFGDFCKVQDIRLEFTIESTFMATSKLAKIIQTPFLGSM